MTKLRLSLIAMVLTCAPFTGRSAVMLDELPQPVLPPGVEIKFRPQDDLEGLLVREIRAAKFEILVSTYAITSDAVIKALVEAYQRKIFIAIIVSDAPSVANYRTPAMLASNGLPVLLSSGLASGGWSNAKFWVFDRLSVFTGSYDPTNAAARVNWESLLILREPSIAASFFNQWRRQATAPTTRNYELR